MHFGNFDCRENALWMQVLGCICRSVLVVEFLEFCARQNEFSVGFGHKFRNAWMNREEFGFWPQETLINFVIKEKRWKIEARRSFSSIFHRNFVTRSVTRQEIKNKVTLSHLKTRLCSNRSPHYHLIATKPSPPLKIVNNSPLNWLKHPKKETKHLDKVF